MKRIISLILFMCIVFGLCTFSAVGSTVEVTTEYKDEFARFALGDKYEEQKDTIFYEEYYRYFSEDNNTDTPDWILGAGYSSVSYPMKYKEFYGDFVITSKNYYNPFSSSHFVYYPAENRFESVQRAWNSGLENLDVALQACSDSDIEGIDNYYDLHQFKYFDKVVDHFGEQYRYDLLWCYDEPCYHYSDENSEEPDWTLIYTNVQGALWDVKYGTIVGNRVLYVVGGGCVRFNEGYAVYVRETDSFILLRDIEKIIEVCPDFVETVEKNEVGRRIGDVNGNGSIDITDATHIQRVIARISTKTTDEWAYLNGKKGSVDFGDFDRDGERTVMDATAIQRHIAQVE